MRKYIIITYTIRVIGGTQAYSAGRAKWLEKKGWDVHIIYEDRREGDCDIPYLNKYKDGRIIRLPLPYHLDECSREIIIDKMVDKIGFQKDDEIIIESHDDLFSYWGELLAERVGGRHYFFACNETYRPFHVGRCTYADNLDFFKFKYLRKELVAPKAVIEKLFNGYDNIRTTLIEYPSICAEQDMVQDIEFEGIDKIPNADWNIACMGRPEKKYVEYVVSELHEFALKHIDRIINIVFVGNLQNAAKVRQLLENLTKNVANVNVVDLGILSPIPRQLFEQMDIVIAAAQTAQFASYENVYVIAANVTSDTTPGVLGYDTRDSWHGGNVPGKKYSEVLEDVLVKRKYDSKVFSMPEHHTAEYYYEEQWPYLELAEKKLEYYTDKFKQNLSRDYVAVFPFWRVKQNSNVLIYGNGMVGQDYLKQADEYCNIVGVIDANADCFDDSVMLPDVGLKKLNYDYVVLAVLNPNIAEEMKKKVLYYFSDDSKIIHQIKYMYW